jgi:hypothetical protein
MVIVLPKGVLYSLRVKEGDTLYLTEAPNSSPAITPECPRFKEVMALEEGGTNRCWNALRELAK